MFVRDDSLRVLVLNVSPDPWVSLVPELLTADSLFCSSNDIDKLNPDFLIVPVVGIKE